MAKKKKKGAIQTLQDEIVDVCLRRGIIFPSAEIYGGAAGFYEFGPVGSALRQNLINLWRDMFINSEDNISGVQFDCRLSGRDCHKSFPLSPAKGSCLS